MGDVLRNIFRGSVNFPQDWWILVSLKIFFYWQLLSELHYFSLEKWANSGTGVGKIIFFTLWGFNEAGKLIQHTLRFTVAGPDTTEVDGGTCLWNRICSFWRCSDLTFKSAVKYHSKAEVSTGMKHELKSQHTYNSDLFLCRLSDRSPTPILFLDVLTEMCLSQKAA